MTKYPLVLLPGILNDASLWKHQILHFINKNPVYVANFNPYTTISSMAEAVLSDIGHTPFFLCGLSMGGYVALEIMRKKPQMVLGLGLFNTSARADTKEQRIKRFHMMELAEMGNFHGVTPRLLPSLLHQNTMHNEKIKNTVLNMASRTGKDVFIRHQKAIMERSDSLESIKKITCPTIIVGADEDIIAPKALQEEMALYIARSRLFIAHSAGHLTPIEQPDFINQIMDEWMENIYHDLSLQKLGKQG